MEKLFSGAQLHIWCEGNKTLLKIINNYGQEDEDLVPAPIETFIILSDTNNGMTCDLKFKVI